MTDGQWALLAPLLPAAGSTGGRGGRPEKWDRRLVLDAIFYLVRGGIAWRALPADFPPHQTVYALFRRWTRARAWCRNAALRERARLADGRGPVPTACLQDRDGAFRITAALREAFSTITLVWADAGYTGRFVRDARKIWDLAVAIVKRSDQAKGFVLLHRRWVVERSFAWLTKFRRLVRTTRPSQPPTKP
ncbi:MAG TPA: transposase [Streptosporangiaceae bacterium]